ncbi:hypothetical protein D9M72_652780 [compost metagenome]
MPLSVGVVSSVTPPLAMAPVTVPVLSSAPVMDTVTSRVSSVKSMAGLLAPRLPATSMTACASSCAPSTSGVVGVNVQLPSASAGTRPIPLPWS